VRGGAHADLAARRFSKVALWCFIAMAVSGTINAAVRIRPGDLFTTTYGWLVATKVVALVVLGLIGWWQRSVAVAALRSDPSAGGLLIRLSLIEALVFGSTFGIAVGLGRTPPPPPKDLNPSAAEVALGYDLAGPPTVTRILTDWRFDLVFGTAAIIFAALYLVAVLRLRRRGDRWPARRTGAWLLGCAVLLFATSSGAGRYQPAMFSAHLAGHLLLGVLAPILLVRGAPTTLAMRALPSAASGEPPGPREWLSAALHSASARFCTHPVVAVLMFASGFYLLYLGGIFDAAAGQHGARVVMTAVFGVTGYLLCWVVVGADPRPSAASVTSILAAAVAAIGSLSLFGLLLMGMRDVVAGRFYRSLQLPWRSDFLADQHLGAALIWAVCGVALVMVLVALVIRWRRPAEGTGSPQQDCPQKDSPQQVLHPQR
jgi:putative copper resistance protein D